MAGFSNVAFLGLQVANAYQSFSQSQAEKDAGRQVRSAYEFNAKMADLQAEDAVARGKEASDKSRRDTKRLIGAQRAAAAASGIEVDSGSALDLQLDAAGFGAMDALTIKNNAAREALGYKAQALDYRSRGAMAEANAKTAAAGTLLTGGIRAFDIGLRQYEFGSRLRVPGSPARSASAVSDSRLNLPRPY